MVLARTATLLAVVSLAGCTSWPEHGRGGLAELFATDQTPPAAADGQRPGAEVDPITFQLDLVRRHLDVLVLEGAELCFPATVVLARQRENRIAREVDGGLLHDAANDIVIQRQVLNRLERQLDHAHAQGVCQVAVGDGDQRPGEFAEQLSELLNTDNQFAENSPELNPKYVARLGEAAAMLRERSRYRLRITGHADARGEATRNRDLSLQRAEQVKRYLQIMGIAGDRIDVAAVGSDNPLFAGGSPATRLANRRVSVEVIEPTGGE